MMQALYEIFEEILFRVDFWFDPAPQADDSFNTPLPPPHQYPHFWPVVHVQSSHHRISYLLAKPTKTQPNVSLGTELRVTMNLRQGENKKLPFSIIERLGGRREGGQDAAIS